MVGVVRLELTRPQGRLVPGEGDCQLSSYTPLKLKFIEKELNLTQSIP